MSSTKPYLIRAIHEWATDSNYTPQILVSESVEGVKVPQNHVKDGHIVFNVHDNAVQQLNLGNEIISFSARFSGQAMNIEVPIDAVMAIYARENGQGIFFQEDQQSPPPEPQTDTQTKTPVSSQENIAPASKSHLKLVK